MGKTTEYLRLVGARAFKDFAWVRDFTVGFIMSPITLILSIRWGLGAADDWKYHKWFLVLAVVAPYLVVIFVHVSWRIFKAAKDMHHELSDRLSKQISITGLIPGDPIVEVRFVDDGLGYLEVINRGNADIYWVRVFPLSLAKRILDFDYIQAKLAPDARTAFSPDVGNQWGTFENRNRDFMRALSENWAATTDSSLGIREAKCKAKMEYEDALGTRFELSFEILYWTSEKKRVECRDFSYRRIPIGITPLE